MLKKISVLFLVLLSCLFLSAAEANAYYRVTTAVLNARSGPDKSAAKVKQYAKYEVLYITSISTDNKWGYVAEDYAWVHLSYVRRLNAKELEAYMAYRQRQGGTSESADGKPSSPNGSRPLRIILWVFLGLIILGPLFMFLRDDQMRSVGVCYATMLLSVVVFVVISYAQFVLCWGLKIVGWIEHYVFFGWLVDAFANGILAIIPFVLDLPTFGLYGLIAGALPVMAFYGITKLFDEDDYPFVKWVVYIFQLALFIAVLLIDNGDWYDLFNPILQLDGASAVSALANACDWGEYANNVFVFAFYVGTICLLLPIAVWQRILDK